MEVWEVWLEWGIIGPKGMRCEGGVAWVWKVWLELNKPATKQMEVMVSPPDHYAAQRSSPNEVCVD